MKKYNEKTVDVGGATGMSGADKAKLSNIALDVEQIKAISITYSELKALRDAGNLVPGRQYRITDYHCTTTQADTMSADHQFDIIVVADTNSVLNENARACLHAGDTYFSSNGCKLESWQLKYCIDNDDTRFAWADTTNGKGVIFFMKDEWSNECPYDFKNIMFKYGILFDDDNYPYFDNDGEGTYLYTFSAFDMDNEEWMDAYLAIGRGADDGCCSLYCNVIKPYCYDYDRGENSQCVRLNYIVFVNSFSDNECCYFECNSNIFGNSCYYNIFGNSCYYNTFGNICQNNIFRNGCIFNTFENCCYYNTFGDNCGCNTFGNDCSYNTFGNSCSSNTFGNSVNSKSINNDTFGEQFWS